MVNDPTTTGMPLAVETVLIDAAHSPEFAQALVADLDRALSRRGHRLTDSQRALLRAVPTEQLSQMLTRLRQVTPAPAPPGAADDPWAPPGDENEAPPSSVEALRQRLARDVPPREIMSPGGARPEAPTPKDPVLVTGHMADWPPAFDPDDSGGSGRRKGCLVAAAIAAAALVGGGLTITAGIRPQDQPAAEQAERHDLDRSPNDAGPDQR